ncbi:dynein regulatory complex subunit 2-like isoform X1 [Anguilla rostrata]|uniref:dynein regulatory complex subunit 2-like isoform X1 n=1 Tax=Anguilla rostrata TaxID=7938 RepID=UPI0030CD7E06
MAKKKKKGKGKSVPMTEEERELYMKQKALAEEEAAKKKQAMLIQFLKDKLQKEEKNSVTNQHKLTEKWRAVFRQACAQELRRDIAVLSHTFERVLGHKDSIIKCMLCDLKETKQQSAHALSSYVQCVDQLLDHQKGRVSSLERQWSSMLEIIGKDFRAERQLILTQHEKECKYLEEVNFAIDQYYSEVDSDVRQDFQSTCVDIENRNTEERNTLRVQLEGDVELLWNQVQHTVWSYRESTEDQYVALESLQAHDKLCVDEIELHVKKLHKLQDSIVALRARLSCTKEECFSALGGLRAVKEEVTMQGQQLKVQMCTTRVRDKNHLASLVKHCNATSKKIQAIILKGEKLLRLMEACRRLEKEREKVYYSTSQSAEEQVLLNSLCMEPMSEEMVKNIQEVSPLESFWHRYNAALKEHLCLQQEQARMTEQNRHLRTQLRNFLDGVSVCDDVLRHSNPLLIISKPQGHRDKPPPLLPAPCTRRSISVVQLTF